VRVRIRRFGKLRLRRKPRQAECVERALELPPSLERTFWLEALRDVLRALPAEACDLFLGRASRRIDANFDVPPDERQAAALAVVTRALPIG
jgi:hypothetical protein